MGLFEEQIARKPNNYPWADDFIEAIWQGFWTPAKFDFNSDYADFHNTLTDEEKQIIVRTLSAIGQVEIAVKRFWSQLGDNLPNPAMHDLGLAMAATEVIHGLAYEKLLDKLHLEEAFEENLKVPVVKGRVNYLRKHTKKVFADKKQQYIYSIILFTLFVENVSLFSQFYIILHFNRFRALLKDTAKQVDYTKLEETLHAQVGIRIINTLRTEYPELFDDALIEKIREETQEAFKAESAIIDWIVGGYEDGNLSAPILKAYIGERMNDSLKAIGFNESVEIDHVALDKANWMTEELLATGFSDFFHTEDKGYAKNNKTYNEDDLGF
jgi:ribonucleoside-diphosphate reductase beta chain